MSTFAPPSQTVPVAPTPPVSTRVSVITWFALVAGIFWIGGLGSLFALVVGFVVRSSPASPRDRSFATACIVLGAIGLALTVLSIWMGVASSSSTTGSTISSLP